MKGASCWWNVKETTVGRARQDRKTGAEEGGEDEQAAERTQAKRIFRINAKKSSQTITFERVLAGGQEFFTLLPLCFSPTRT